MTQRIGQTLPGLIRLHEAARRDRRLRFNNLLHHVTVELLEKAYYALNRKAAPGVDGENWSSYGEKLHERLPELHQRLHTQRDLKNLAVFSVAYGMRYVKRNYVCRNKGVRVKLSRR